MLYVLFGSSGGRWRWEAELPRVRKNGSDCAKVPRLDPENNERKYMIQWDYQWPEKSKHEIS